MIASKEMNFKGIPRIPNSALICFCGILLCSYLPLPTIETLAGNGNPGTTDGPALSSELANPFGIVRGPDGNIWFCEYDGHTVRRIDQQGQIKTMVGNGQAGYSGDGGPPLLAQLNRPHEIRFDNQGLLYIADMSNHAIRQVDLVNGTIRTIAGTGTAGFSGDKGLATHAQLDQPHSIQFGPEGRLYVADIGNHRVRIIDLESGVINTFAGNGETGPTPNNSSFDDIPLFSPRSIDFDAFGNLWLVLRNANQVWRFDMEKMTVHHVAGNGQKGFTGNGGDPLKASLSGPKGITISSNGDIYIADTESHSVRVIKADTGLLEVAVGNGSKYDGEDGDPLKCGLARPHGLFADRDGSILIGDSENHKIRIFRP